MEPARLNSECIECLLNKYLKYYPENADEKQKIEYMKRIMKILSEAPMSAGAPELVDEISRAQKEVFGFVEDFSEEKKYFNSLMMGFENSINDELDLCDDRLERAVAYSMMGNYIDFGAVENVDETELQRLLQRAKDIPIDRKELELLKKDLASARSLVFLTDNCGEVVLDKVLLNVIKNLYPQVGIEVIVRGRPVLNDVTMEDARQVGLSDVFCTIPNGSSVAGTCMERISEEARKKIENADVIIAKGQGNFETLRFCGKNVYYIFMCKCRMFANRFGVERFSGMLVNDFRLDKVV